MPSFRLLSFNSSWYFGQRFKLWLTEASNEHFSVLKTVKSKLKLETLSFDVDLRLMVVVDFCASCDIYDACESWSDFFFLLLRYVLCDLGAVCPLLN